MSQRKYGVSAIFFEQMREFWHAGVDPEEMVERVNAMALPLKLSGRFQTASDVDKFAIDNLMKGELVAMSIGSLLNRKTLHWTLGIGAGGIQLGHKAQPDTLYLLDASASSPVFRSHNAVMTLLPAIPRRKRVCANPPGPNKRKPLAWGYEAPEWNAEPVRIISAIRFRRTD